MNETETRAELIDPAIASAGWGTVEGTRVRREFEITQGRIQPGGRRARKLKADYVLVYRGKKLATIEAKSNEKEVAEGVAQAKDYAKRLNLQTTFATNGKEIYRICMRTGDEGPVERYPTPQELWDSTFAEQNEWRDRFAVEPYNDVGGSKPPRFYQENAVDAVLDAIAEERDRILLTLATGTGKTFIAFQIAWKLFHTRWNLHRAALAFCFSLIAIFLPIRLSIHSLRFPKMHSCVSAPARSKRVAKSQQTEVFSSRSFRRS